MMVLFLSTPVVAGLPGTDLQSGEEVALKLTYIQDNLEVIQGEKEIYEALNVGIAIP